MAQMPSASDIAWATDEQDECTLLLMRKVLIRLGRALPMGRCLSSR